MSGLRDYNAGELIGRAISREEQLANPANFIENGQLYLVRCLACGPPPRGRENYVMAVGSGTCAWCGWHEDSNQERKPG